MTRGDLVYCDFR